MANRHHLRSPIGHQAGAALLIGLIMLLVLTLIGVAALSNAALQEKMAGGHADRNLAFQAAELALRRAEDYVTQRNGATSDTANGDAIYDVSAVASRPDPYDVGAWDADYLSAPAVSGLTTAPRYRIESQIKVSDSHPTLYRLTAIGYGNRAGSTVVLQTTFGVPVF